MFPHCRGPEAIHDQPGGELFAFHLLPLKQVELLKINVDFNDDGCNMISQKNFMQ